LQQDVQERELSLIREYETKLLARQEEDAAHDLASSTAVSESLGRISNLLRQFLRTIGGEDPDPLKRQVVDEDDEDREPRNSESASTAEHTLEREIELVRLEKENEELRRMIIGLVPAHARRANPEPRATFEPPPRLGMLQRDGMGRLGGAPGTVGPFGKYKRMRSPG
jgi:hypothetical protein